MPKNVSNQDVLNKKFNITNSCYSIFHSKNILKTHSGLLAYVSQSGLEKGIIRRNKKCDSGSVSTTTTTTSFLTSMNEKTLRKRRTSPILNVKKTAKQKTDYFKQTRSENLNLLKTKDIFSQAKSEKTELDYSLLSVSNSNLSSFSEKTLKEFDSFISFHDKQVEKTEIKKTISFDSYASQHFSDEVTSGVELKLDNQPYFIFPNYAFVTKFSIHSSYVSITPTFKEFSYKLIKIETILVKSIEINNKRKICAESYKKFMNTYNLIKNLYKLGNRKYK